MKPTKLETLLNKAQKVSSLSSPKKEFDEALHDLGRECYVMLLQGKLLEVKYDGSVLNYKGKLK